MLVLIRLVVPAAWTIPIHLGTTQYEPEVASTSIDAKAVAATATLPNVLNETTAVERPNALPTAKAAAVDTQPDEHDRVLAAPTPVAPIPAPTISIFAIVGAIWLAGTAFVLRRSARRIGRFHRALRDTRTAPASIQMQVQELARRMGLKRCPELLLVPGRLSPALWMPGVFARRARLILPAGLLPLLDAGQRESVIAHELAHLRRGDPWVRWLELIVGALYWWHPLLGWFRRELRSAEEECCDLSVVAAQCSRRAYATALVETAAYLGNTGPVPALASAVAPVRHLQRRVTMIMRATWPARLTRAGLVAVLGVGGVGLAFGPALAQDKREDPKPKDERKAPPAKEDNRPRERGKDVPRDDQPRERAPQEAVEKARIEVERARKLAHEAMEQLQAAEEALARIEGRPVPPRAGRGPDRGPGDRGQGDRGRELPVPPGEPGVRGRDLGGVPMPPGFPGGGRRPGVDGPPGGDFKELQQQVEELRRALDQMRQELRRDRGGERGGDRKDADPRGGDRKERGPKDEPKRPAGEPERRDF